MTAYMLLHSFNLLSTISDPQTTFLFENGQTWRLTKMYEAFSLSLVHYG